jgi:hypothetical protein
MTADRRQGVTLSTGRRFRIARERAGSALLTYLEEGTSSSEQALLEAAHELEAVAARRRLERGCPPRRVDRLARLAMSR